MLPQDPLVLQPVSEAVVHAEVAGQLEGVPVLVALDPALQAVAEVLEELYDFILFRHIAENSCGRIFFQSIASTLCR